MWLGTIAGIGAWLAIGYRRMGVVSGSLQEKGRG